MIVIPNRDFSVAMLSQAAVLLARMEREGCFSYCALAHCGRGVGAGALACRAPPLQMYEQTVPCTHWQVLRCAETVVC